MVKCQSLTSQSNILLMVSDKGAFLYCFLTFCEYIVQVSLQQSFLILTSLSFFEGINSIITRLLIEWKETFYVIEDYHNSFKVFSFYSWEYLPEFYILVGISGKTHLPSRKYARSWGTSHHRDMLLLGWVYCTLTYLWQVRQVSLYADTHC